MTTPSSEVIAAARVALSKAWTQGADDEDLATAALSAAHPIMEAQAKAEALREAADWLTEMASGYTRESPRLLAGREIISQLRARADHAEFLAKAGADPEGQRLADAAAALAG